MPENSVCILALIVLSGVLLAWITTRASFPKRFRAKCIWVCDGDTIRVRRGWFRASRKLRLIGMDAPEGEQEFGRQATLALRGLVLGKTVRVEAIGTDRYGRWVSRVYSAKTDVSLQMIRMGCAWPYYAYFGNLTTRERTQYEKAGREARSGRLGLWAGKNPEAPWDWRKRHRSLFWRFVLWLKSLVRRLFGKSRR